MEPNGRHISFGLNGNYPTEPLTWEQSKTREKSKRREVFATLRSPKRKIAVLEGRDVSAVKRRLRRRRRILNLVADFREKSPEEQISTTSSDTAKFFGKSPISAGAVTQNVVFTFNEEDRSRQEPILALFTDVRPNIQEEKISLEDNDVAKVPLNTPMSAGAINDNNVFNFSEEAMMCSLKLGEGDDKVCMSPKHEVAILKQFLRTHPELGVDFAKLQRLADNDLFQWWMFDNCSVSETLLGMKGLVERALRREKDLD